MKGWTQESLDKLGLKQVGSVLKRKKRIPKRKTLPQLIKQLDDVFSIYVRKSNEDENGIIRCFTCGRAMTFKIAQNGHYIGRQYKAVRFSEINCQPQCAACNLFNEGEKVKFRENLVKKYGEQEVIKLEQQKNNRFRMERGVIELLISEYQKKISEL